MEQPKDNKEIEIDLSKIFYKMKNKFIFIIILTIFAGLISGLITHFFVKPTYTATVKMYVYSNTDRISSDSTITPNELTASQDLINTYIYILKSDTVLNEVAKDLNLNVSAGQLRSAINAKQAENTIAFEVTVSAKAPKTAAKVANSIAKIAPDQIVRVVKAGGVEIIDYAKVPKKPSSPNLKKNIFIAAAIMAVLSFFGFFIYAIFDTTVTSSRDIESEFDIPIIGTVPNLLPSSEDSSKYYYSYGNRYGYGRRYRYGNSSVPKLETNKTTETTADKINAAPVLKPSNTVLENIQNMKGDGKNE